MEMITTGRMIDADEALKRALILDVIPKENWKESLTKKVEAVASRGRMSLQAAKSVLRNQCFWDRDRAEQLEREAFGTLFDSGEPQEGMAAFLEKRTPNF